MALHAWNICLFILVWWTVGGMEISRPGHQELVAGVNSSGEVASQNGHVVPYYACISITTVACFVINLIPGAGLFCFPIGSVMCALQEYLLNWIAYTN